MKGAGEIEEKSKTLMDFWRRRLGERTLVVTEVACEETDALRAKLAEEEKGGGVTLATLQVYADAYAEQRALIDDDSVPVVAPCNWEGGFWRCVVGAREERGGAATSYLRDYEEALEWEFSETSPWVLALKGQFLQLARCSGGRYRVGRLALIEPLHFVLWARGRKRALADLRERADKARWLTGFAGALNRFLSDIEEEILKPHQTEMYCESVGPVPASTKLVNLGAYSGMGAEVFEEYGRAELERLGGYLGGLILRAPMESTEVLVAAGKMKSVIAVEIQRKSGSIRLSEDVDAAREALDGTPLLVETGSAELRGAIEEGSAPRGVLYVVRDAGDAAEANALANLARAYAG